jgi:acetate kinase
MATRSGDFPADAVFYLLKEGFYTAESLELELEKHSGLLGASLGLSDDMRALESSNEAQANLALAYFEYDVLKYIGAYAAALQGLDALVFTAGIGENDAAFRARILNKLTWLGITIDKNVNVLAVGGKQVQKISANDSQVMVYVIPTNEELMIAHNVAELYSSK